MSQSITLSNKILIGNMRILIRELQQNANKICLQLAMKFKEIYFVVAFLLSHIKHPNIIVAPNPILPQLVCVDSSSQNQQGENSVEVSRIEEYFDTYVNHMNSMLMYVYISKSYIMQYEKLHTPAKFCPIGSFCKFLEYSLIHLQIIGIVC